MTRRSSRVGSVGVEIPPGRVGSGQEVFKCHGSDRVAVSGSNPREDIRFVKVTLFFFSMVVAVSGAMVAVLSGWERVLR